MEEPLTMKETVNVNKRGDESVTNSAKWEIELDKHFWKVIEKTSIPLQDSLEAVVFTTFAFALDGRPLFGDVWFRKTLVVAAGLIATDLFAPAMASSMRMSLALVFYSQATAA